MQAQIAQAQADYINNFKFLLVAMPLVLLLRKDLPQANAGAPPTAHD